MAGRARIKPALRRRLPLPVYRVWRRARIELVGWLDLLGRRRLVEEQLLASVAGGRPLRVEAGPFAGMRYAPASSGSELVPKLLGTYEEELHPAIEDVIAGGYDIVVNVGCAEGFYAVGLARRMPTARVLAYDIDDGARRLCSAMAELNGVSERVDLRSEFSPADLGAVPGGSRTVVIMDCEGCEDALMDPGRVPGLRSVTVVVELHDFISPGIADRIRARFEPTHVVELVDARRRSPSTHPATVALGRRATRVAVDERRPPGMQWAVLRPRGETQGRS